jgi:hypothetical protein
MVQSGQFQIREGETVEKSRYGGPRPPGPNSEWHGHGRQYLWGAMVRGDAMKGF